MTRTMVLALTFAFTTLLVVMSSTEPAGAVRRCKYVPVGDGTFVVDCIIPRR